MKADRNVLGDAPAFGYWRLPLGAETRAFWSGELRTIFGMPLDGPAWRGDAVAHLFEDAAAFEMVRARIRDGVPFGPLELWIRRADDGVRRLLRLTNGVERDETGAAIAAYGLAVDVTDYQRSARTAAESEELLRAFVDHAPAALAMLDRDMRYLRVSPRWLSDYQLEGMNLIGRSHYEIFPEIPDSWKEVHQRCLAGAVERCERDRFDRADGATQWLSWEVRPWRFSSGAIGGILMMTRDISELVQSFEIVEQTQRRLQIALEASEMLVWQRDKRTRKLTVDGAAQKLLGRTPPIGEDAKLLKLIHEDDREALRLKLREAVARRATVTHEHRALGAGGAEFWARSIIEPQFDETGAHAGFIGVLRDITKQRHEKDILDRARRAAEAASSAKSDFVATMSHEIRTPLNGVLGAVQLLARTELDEEQQRLVDLLLSAGHALRALVDDAIDLERIESASVRLRSEPFDLGLAVRRASELFAATAIEKGLRFAVDTSAADGLIVRGDPLRVRQIVGNLVGNAVKFTDVGGVAVGAEARVNAQGEAALVVMVRDSGVGVAAGDHDRIFERFGQAGDGSRGGAGLGLAVARNLARAMNGDVRVESDLGEGASFVFTARFAADAAALGADPAALREADAALAGCAILVAEDNNLNRVILDLMLRPTGAALRFVEDGEAACAAFVRERFDLVLMDMQMPRMGGAEAIAEIRARERASGAARTPILCVTAQESARGAAAAFACGADGHVSKPIVVRELLAAIGAALTDAERRAA